MTIKTIAEYPEEGFAILEDDNGRFLAFKNSEKFEEFKKEESLSDKNQVGSDIWDIPGTAFKLSHIM